MPFLNGPTFKMAPIAYFRLFHLFSSTATQIIQYTGYYSLYYPPVKMAKDITTGGKMLFANRET